MHFTGVATINARNQAAIQNYDFTDVSPLPGASWYRLRIGDMDGKESFSSIVAIHIRTANTLNIFPNPVRDYIIVAHPRAVSNTSITVFSADGSKVASYKPVSNSLQTLVTLKGLNKGTYLVKFENGEERLVEKFIKQ